RPTSRVASARTLGINTMSSKQWQSYEEVAAYLLNEFAEHFALGRVEGKQLLAGSSGTSWEIDAKGIKTDDKSIVVIECKCYPNARVTQGIIATLAYSIEDVGAKGGIIVTPVGLQEGAAKVAAHNGITLVKLAPGSTTTEYLVRFLNKVCVGLTGEIRPSGRLSAVHIRAGKVTGRRES
ncbi:MAG: restriction endonuclease, partial [Burkholderiaceae bacterium]